jgi:hypothetical protein
MIRTSSSAQETTTMLSPAVLFLLLLVIGIVAGLAFDRFAGPGWLSRQVAGGNRLMVTSALVGIAGSFVASIWRCSSASPAMAR